MKIQVVKTKVKKEPIELDPRLRVIAVIKATDTWLTLLCEVMW